MIRGLRYLPGYLDVTAHDALLEAVGAGQWRPLVFRRTQIYCYSYDLRNVGAAELASRDCRRESGAAFRTGNHLPHIGGPPPPIIGFDGAEMIPAPSSTLHCLHGGGWVLVCSPVFKTGVTRFAGQVGSIPTRSRQFIEPGE